MASARVVGTAPRGHRPPGRGAGSGPGRPLPPGSSERVCLVLIGNVCNEFKTLQQNTRAHTRTCAFAHIHVHSAHTHMHTAWEPARRDSYSTRVHTCAPARRGPEDLTGNRRLLRENFLPCGALTLSSRGLCPLVCFRCGGDHARFLSHSPGVSFTFITDDSPVA